MKPVYTSNLPLVLLGSLCANALIWYALGQGSNQPVKVSAPPELVFDRVTIEKKPNAEKPVFHPIQFKPRPPVQPKVQPKMEEPKPVPAKAPAPEGAHNRILTAAPAVAKPSEPFAAPAGGNAPLGKPTAAQNPGNGVVNPPKPADPTPPTPTTPPVTTQKPVAPVPPVVPVVQKHEDPPPVQPVTPPPAKPKGETREAKPDRQESVEIPENLKSQSFKSFVRVRVNISADGKFTVVLRTSSGNTDVDKLVLDTLNKWTWKPALKDGEPVDSVQQFRFNFTIE